MKQFLREEMLRRRDAVSVAERAHLNNAISTMLVQRPAFINAKVIAFYIAKGSEVDLRKAIEFAMEKRKNILVPVTNEHIEMVAFSGFENLRAGRFGILEPIERKQGPEPAVVIVPGVAFGLCMHRIGYGKGYYDRYLKKTNAYKIGICYDFQLLESLPSHHFDEKMDEIITEKRVIARKP